MLGMNELPNVRKHRQLEEYNSTSYMGAAFEQSWTEAPLDSIWRDRELRLANVGQKEVKYTYTNPLMGRDIQITETQPKKRLSEEEAKAQIKDAGVPLSVPETSYTQEALDIIIERKKAELLRKDQMDRAKGIVPAVGQFTAMLAAQIVDPINIAASFVPVVGPARYTAMMSRATTAGARALVRAKVGAIEGVVGAAIVEPFVYRATQREQADYTMYDSMLNIGLGSVMGAGLHSGFGAIGDLIRKGVRPDVATATAKPTGKTAKVIAEANPETREAMLKSSIAQELEGKPTNVEAVAAFDNKLNFAYEPGVLSRLKRPEYQSRLTALLDESQRISKVTGFDEASDSFREAITKLGGINRMVAESEGIDPASFKGNRLYRKDGGKTLDEMAETLNQYGYVSEDGSPLTANSLLDIISDDQLLETLSTSATKSDELSMIRELKQKGYSNSDIEKAINKALKGDQLGANQQRIVEDALLTIGGRRFEEGYRGRRAAEKDVRGKTEAQIEEELGRMFDRPMSDEQANRVDWYLEQVEAEEMDLSDAYLAIKDILEPLPKTTDTNQTLENTIRNDVKRGSDVEASRQADEAIAKPELDIDQELDFVNESVSNLEQITGTKAANMKEFDDAILKAEEDAKALEAAVICRLTK